MTLDLQEQQTFRQIVESALAGDARTRAAVAVAAQLADRLPHPLGIEWTAADIARAAVELADAVAAELARPKATETVRL